MSKQQIVLDEYFQLNLFMLKVAGVWIPGNETSTKKRIFFYIYDIFWITYCVILYQPAESAVMFQTSNFSTIVRALRDQFNHLICLYKLFIWFTQRKLILYIMETLQNNKFVYNDEAIDAEGIFKKYKKEADTWAKIFLLGVNFICLNMCFSVLYLFLFHSNALYKADDKGNLIYTQELPASLFVPYDRTTKTTFILTFIFEIFALDIYGWMIIGTNLNKNHFLIFCLRMCFIFLPICYRFRYAIYKFNELHQCTSSHNPRSFHDYKTKMFKKIGYI